VFVLTTIPSTTGVAHDGARFLLPSISAFFEDFEISKKTIKS